MAQTLKLVRGSSECSLLQTGASMEDETGATFGPTVPSLSLANGYAWAVASGVDLSPFAGTEGVNTPYSIVYTDENGKKAWGYISEADAAWSAAGELLSNTGFETLGGGAPDVFANWTESAGTGTIVDGANPHGGARSCRLTAGAGADTYVKQAVTVTAGRAYCLDFFHQSGSSYPGRFRIYDATNAAWITSMRTLPDSSGGYAEAKRYFAAPASCSSVEIYLYCPAQNSEHVDFDDISVTTAAHVGATGVHVVSQKGGSIRNWSSIESGFAYNSSAYTFDVYDSGFHLLDPGWVPAIPALLDTPGLVDEVMNIECTGFSVDSVAAEMAWLTKMAASAARFVGDRTEINPVWLQDQLSGETYARRALVYSIRLSNMTQYHGAGEDGGSMLDYRPQFQLGITRGPWEATTAMSTVTANTVSSLGGTFDYSTVDVPGTAPARLNALGLTCNNQPYEFWVGFRSQNKHPDATGFVALWEAESAADGTDVADAVDATASGGNKSTCSFATTATWAQRLAFLLGTFITDEAEGYGTFLILARLKNSGAGTNQVKIRRKYSTSGSYADNRIVDVASASWNLYDLGTVTFPLEDRRAVTTAGAAATYDHQNVLDFWAREVSGTVDLDIDCLVLIPMDELLIHGITAQTSNGVIVVYTGPLGQTVATTSGGGAFYDAPVVDLTGAGVPLGDGRAFVAYRRTSSHVITDTVDMSMSSIARWHTLRGVE